MSRASRYDARACAGPITTVRSASRAAMLSRSAAEAATTDSMPSVRAARTMRSAISPRLAIRIRRSGIAGPSADRLDQKERLVELDQLRIFRQHLAHRAGNAGTDRGEEFHYLYEADLGRGLHLLSDRDIWRRARL